MLAAPDNDALLVIFTPVDPSCSEQIVEAIQDGIARARAAGATNKPILACVMAEAPGRVSLHAGAERIPTYTFPENAVRALGKVAAYATWRAQPAGLFWGFDDMHLEDARAICRKALAERGDTWLTDQRDVGRAPCVRHARGSEEPRQNGGRGGRVRVGHRLPRRRQAGVPEGVSTRPSSAPCG